MVDTAEKPDPAAADLSFPVSVRKSSFEVKHMIANPSLVVLKRNHYTMFRKYCSMVLSRLHGPCKPLEEDTKDFQYVLTF